MSITRLSRERGIIIRCNGEPTASLGVEHKSCDATLYTANVYVKSNRSFAAMQGWGRGLRKGHKRNDLCPPHMEVERALVAKQKAERDAERKHRDELKKAKVAAGPSPKRSRKKSPSSNPTNSPSADSAPGPASP